MNRRLRLTPPKQTLAARSGSATKPIGLPAGLNTLTPSKVGLMPHPHHRLPSTSQRKPSGVSSGWPVISISSALDPHGFRPAYAQCQNPMQQVGIGEPVMQGRRGKLLDPGNLGIGVGLDVIRDAIRGEAKIDAGVAVELQRPIDPLGGAPDAGNQLRREVLRRPRNDAAALLVSEIVLDLFGGDRPRALRHGPEFELPDREDTEPVVAQHADVELATLDILLGYRRGANPLV